jgi:hypothetical protein
LSDPLFVLGIVLIPVVCGIGTAAVYHRRQYLQGANGTPERLFSELALAHQLSRSQARLLRQMADEVQLDEPSLIYLSIDEFDRATETLRSERVVAKKRTIAEIKSIRDRLFRTTFVTEA